MFKQIIIAAPILLAACTPDVPPGKSSIETIPPIPLDDTPGFEHFTFHKVKIKEQSYSNIYPMISCGNTKAIMHQNGKTLAATLMVESPVLQASAKQQIEFLIGQNAQMKSALKALVVASKQDGQFYQHVIKELSTE